MALEDRLYPLLALYERSPAPLRWAAGSLYRLLPERLRLGEAFAGFERLAARFDSAPMEAIEAFQLEQLRKTLEAACSGCEYYRMRFREAGIRPRDLTSLADLKALPFLDKKDLQDHLGELANQNLPESDRLYITTGGSTGIPTGFYLQNGVSRPKEQAFLERMWSRAGYRKGDRLAVIRGHVTTDRNRGRISSYDATRDWLMLSSSHLTPDRLMEYVEALRKFRPVILHAYPSAALLLARLLRERNVELGVQLRAVLCGSESLTTPQKHLLEAAFGCRVYRWYGHAERVVLAGEGTKSDLLYFFPQYGYAEFGEPDEDGLREVIGTSFHNAAMPFIRYRTGDYVEVVEEEAQKEFPWPAVRAVRGRGQEFLVSRSGRHISLTAFNMHDAIFDGLYAVQFYQREKGKAELRYVAGPSFEPSRLNRIESGVRRKLGDDFELTLREVSATEKTSRGKHKWLVSELGSRLDGRADS